LCGWVKIAQTIIILGSAVKCEKYVQYIGLQCKLEIFLIILLVIILPNLGSYETRANYAVDKSISYSSNDQLDGGHFLSAANFCAFCGGGSRGGRCSTPADNGQKTLRIYQYNVCLNAYSRAMAMVRLRI
jgi:hypothetical protein